MRIRTVNGTKIQDFESILDLTTYLNATPYNRFFLYEHKSSIKGTKEFTGTHDYVEALSLLLNGWSPEARKLSQKVPVMTTTDTVKNTRPTYSTVGFQASTPRFLQGIPTNMIDRKPHTQKQKIITLNKNMSYPAYWKTEDIEEEGIKALQIIQALESKGYRVKLNMFFIAESLRSNNRETVAITVCVKKPEERLSLLKMAFPLIHPSMLRRIVLRWMEVNPMMETDGFVHGYGRPIGDKFPVNKGEYLIPHKIEDIAKYVESISQ